MPQLIMFLDDEEDKIIKNYNAKKQLKLSKVDIIKIAIRQLK